MSDSSVSHLPLDTRETHICGFSLATDKRLYQVFEPLSDRFWSEDEILPRRALILGKIAYIPNILVYYRDNGLSKGAKRNQMAYMDLHLAQAQSRLSTVLQSIKDVEILQRSDKDKLLVVLQRQKASAQRRLALIEGSLTRSSLACLLQIGSKREYGIGRLDYLRIFTVRWLPSVFFGIRPLVLKFRARVNRIQWPKG